MAVCYSSFLKMYILKISIYLYLYTYIPVLNIEPRAVLYIDLFDDGILNQYTLWIPPSADAIIWMQTFDHSL